MSYMQGLDCLNPFDLKVSDIKHGYETWIRVRCGHCINCRITKSREIICRLMCEMPYHDDIAFLTLTYDDSFVPKWFTDKYVIDNDDPFERLTLKPEDLQKYFKRLRQDLERRYGWQYIDFGFKKDSSGKLVPVKIRHSFAPKITYYAVGEYGTKFERLHYHVMLMGLPEKDYDLLGYTKAEWLRMAKKLPIKQHNVAWKFGFIDVRPFYPTHCNYIAAYVQKKLYHSKKFVLTRQPEFSRSSQGLGLQWLKDHLYMFDDEHQTITFGKDIYPLPRYFRKYLVSIGKLSPVFLHNFAVIQDLERKAFLEKCKHEHIDPEEVLKARVRAAENKQRGMLASRNKEKGDEYENS